MKAFTLNCEQQGILALLAKAPIAGQVKTRLAASLGESEALKCYELLLQGTLERMATVAGVERKLFAALDAEDPQLQAWAQQYDFQVLPQCQGDLGARMRAIAEQELQRYSFVLLIGADCPDLDGAYVNQAIEALKSGCEVVLGPSEDGGYVLMGLTRMHRSLFENIPWSTDRVLSTTLDRLADLGVAYHCLETLWDLDDAADHERWCLQHLGQPPR